MSSTTPTPTPTGTTTTTDTTSSSATSSAPSSGCTTRGGPGCRIPTPGSLYLLVFISVLFALVALACGCIARGFWRRRRLRRLGLLPPPRRWGTGVRVGLRADAADAPRPEMYDFYVDRERLAEKAGVEGVWGVISPFSLTFVSPPSASIPPTMPSTPPAAHSGAVSSLPIALLAQRLARLRPPAPTASTSKSTPAGEPPPPASPALARVACVIAMPVPPENRSVDNEQEDDDDDEERPMPLVELGTADVELLGWDVRDRDTEMTAQARGANAVDGV
ncbi:hypothetical protein MIND_00927200 [Mycena indigotica]|uniref:Uncharacterized protein n=1 Tax=Mycena indigotica TaxID=2126181 RepID=A0A8H6SCJ4_9AGAR|nr:uncharacterized protein MIND_00927200 [Mycena indigotica]KAF7296953.1 hypothetical protein MIND_00927200 [Mycena indigotica]